MSINPKDWSPESVKIVLGAVLSIALLLIGRFAPDYRDLATQIAAIIGGSFGASVVSSAWVSGQAQRGINAAIHDGQVSRELTSVAIPITHDLQPDGTITPRASKRPGAFSDN